MCLGKSAKNFADFIDLYRFHGSATLNVAVGAKLVAPPSGSSWTKKTHTWNAKKICRVDMAGIDAEENVGNTQQCKGDL